MPVNYNGEYRFIKLLEHDGLFMPRNIYLLLGFLFLGFGFAGVALPVLPTTPFVLLAALFFSKSSPKWHAWLLDHKFFGSLIKNWQTYGCIQCRVKYVALVCIVIAGMCSQLALNQSVMVRLMGLLLLMAGFIYVARLKVCEKSRA